MTYLGSTLYTLQMNLGNDLKYIGMTPGNRYQKLKCKTLDGTTVRGWFYAVDKRAPAIIMSYGVSLTSCSGMIKASEVYKHLV
jgi:hypothetical protein